MNYFFSLASIIAAVFFFFAAPAAAASDSFPLKDYLTYFYDRYSRHFDDFGPFFQSPDYGIADFTPADNARLIVSLNLYYKYRALSGDLSARAHLRQAIFAALEDLRSRPAAGHSFSDAFAQFGLLKIFEQVPFLLTESEYALAAGEISARAAAGIAAPDTSNRAALSAVYWQYVLDHLGRQKIIAPAERLVLEKMIYQKIKKVLADDLDQNGWYLEGEPRIFNPHYHLITAFAFLAYYEATGDIEFYLAAKKMTANLRAIALRTGFTEAALGSRPAGLGAQFYLGAGLLNCRFRYPDCGAYFSFASGERFFSDPEHPHRLEYHRTLSGRSPDFHDDVSFSNLAELALALPCFKNFHFSLASQRLSGYPYSAVSPGIAVKNDGDTLDYNHLRFRLLASGDRVSVSLKP